MSRLLEGPAWDDAWLEGAYDVLDGFDGEAPEGVADVAAELCAQPVSSLAALSRTLDARQAPEWVSRWAWEVIATAVRSGEAIEGRTPDSWRDRVEELSVRCGDGGGNPLEDEGLLLSRLRIYTAVEGLTARDRAAMRGLLVGARDSGSDLDDVAEAFAAREGPDEATEIPFINQSLQLYGTQFVTGPNAVDRRLTATRAAFDAARNWSAAGGDAERVGARNTLTGPLAIHGARLLRQEGRLDEALEWLDAYDACIESRESGYYWFERAQAERLRGNYAAEEAAILQGLRETPENRAQERAYLLGEQALVLRELGQFEASRRVLEQQREQVSRVDPRIIDVLRAAVMSSEVRLYSDQWDERAALAVIDDILADPAIRAAAPGVAPRMEIVRLELLRRVGDGASVDGEPLPEVMERVLQEPFLQGHERRSGLQLLAECRLDRQEWDRARDVLARLEALKLSTRASAQLAHSVLEMRTAVARARLARATQRDPADLAAACDDVEMALRSMLSRWRDVGARAGGVGFLEAFERRDLVAEAVEMVGVVRGEEAALDLLVDVQRLGSLARALEDDVDVPVSARALRESLPEGRCVLQYMLGRRCSWLFVIDREHVTWHCLAGERSLTELGRELDGWVARRQTGGAMDARVMARIETLRHRAGEALLSEDARDALSDCRELSVLGVEQLDWLPFELLPGLRSDVAIDYPPSIPVLLRLVARRSGDPTLPGHDLLFLSVPTVEEGRLDVSFDELRLSDAQRMALLKPFPPERVLVLEGTDATRTSLEAQRLGDFGVLHLLAHGYFDVEGPEFQRPASLVLGRETDDGGLLRASGVEALAPVSPVVLLSACGTARGERRSGEDGVSHLGGAFLRAGASTVVLSHEAVDFSATVEAMAFVHRRLVEGATVAGALADWRVSAREAGRSVYETSLLKTFGVGHLPAPVRIVRPAAEEPSSASGESPTRVREGGRWLWWIVAASVVAVGAFGLVRSRRARRAQPS